GFPRHDPRRRRGRPAGAGGDSPYGQCARRRTSSRERPAAAAHRPRDGARSRIGTMIEVPRAALRAADLAEQAEFFSFGTNDLTQTALGFSRDDAQGRFLTFYLQHGLLDHDPFQTIDTEGVGELIRIAAERG